MDSFDQIYQANEMAEQEASFAVPSLKAAIYWQAVQAAGCVIVQPDEVIPSRPTVRAAHSDAGEVVAVRSDLKALHGTKA